MSAPAFRMLVWLRGRNIRLPQTCSWKREGWQQPCQVTGLLWCSTKTRQEVVKVRCCGAPNLLSGGVVYMNGSLAWVILKHHLLLIWKLLVMNYAGLPVGTQYVTCIKSSHPFISPPIPAGEAVAPRRGGSHRHKFSKIQIFIWKLEFHHRQQTLSVVFLRLTFLFYWENAC